MTTTLTSKNPFGYADFTPDDVGKIVIVRPRKWWLAIWQWVWFKVLRRKLPCKGTYLITEVTDQHTVTIVDHTVGKEQK